MMESKGDLFHYSPCTLILKCGKDRLIAALRIVVLRSAALHSAALRSATPRSAALCSTAPRSAVLRSAARSQRISLHLQFYG